MTNRKKFFFNGAILSAVGLSMRTVGLIFGAFVTRAIGAEGMGLYTLVMTVYSFALTIATSGIGLTVTRLVAAAIGDGRKSEVGRILRGAVLYALLFSVLSSLALGAGAGFLAEGIIHDGRSVRALRLLALSLVPVALGAVFSGYFVGIKRVGVNSAVQVFSQLAKVGITVILVTKTAGLGTEKSVFALAMGIVFAELISFLLMLLQFCINRGTDGCDGAALSEVSKTALPLAFSAYIRSGLITLEHTLIPKRLRDGGKNTTDSLASYGALHGMALPLVLYPMSPLSSFSGMLVPEFAEGQGRVLRLGRITGEVLNNTLAYAVAISILLYSFSEELGYVIYHSYEAGMYIALIAPIVPIMYLDHVTDSMLKGIGEQVYSMWVNITDSLISVILVWFLIPRLGISGYALVIIIMEAYNFALSLFKLRRKINFSINPAYALVTPAACATLAAFLSERFFVFSGTGTTPLWLALKIIFSLSAFLFFFLILRLISVFSSKKG